MFFRSGFLAGVGAHEERLAAALPDLGRYRPAVGFVAVGEHQLRSFGSEQQRRGLAHAGTGAGDDGHLALQASHGLLLD
jgi:hypothetical protein